MSVRIAPILVAVAGLLVLGQWLWSRGAPAGIEPRLAGADKEQVVVVPPTDLTGKLTVGQGKPAGIAGAWPSFRGEQFDAINKESVALNRTWDTKGPPKLWSVELAEGYAGVAVRNGRVYVLDYDTQAKADTLRCLSLADGQEIWRRSYAVEIGRNHGITRTVPAVTDQYVVTLGPKCHVVCADAITGEFRWGIDLVQKYQAQVPEWYAGQCPLIDNGRVILATGGKNLLIAVDLASGKVIWESPNPRQWRMTHSSIAPMTVGGKRTYVYCGSGGVAGVSADDGAILWDTTEWKVTMATVPTPVVIDESRIFLTGGYGAGSMMLDLRRGGVSPPSSTHSTAEGGETPPLRQQGEKIEPAVVYRLKPAVFGSDQHTPILYDGHIYGVIPGGQLACVDLDGKRLWASGGKSRFGLGPFMIADGMIITLGDTGQLTLTEATPDEYKPVAAATLWDDGHEAWAPLALVNGRLLARDITRMVCLDLRRDRHD